MHIPHRVVAVAASPARTAPPEGSAFCGRKHGHSVHRAIPSCQGPRARLFCPGPGALLHLSTGAVRPPSSAKGLSQPQKLLSARRSSATCWVLDSWRSGL